MTFCEELMNPVPIRNKRFLKVLQEGEDIVRAREFEMFPVCGKGQEMDNWVSREYLDHILDLGVDHDGFPKNSLSWNLAKLKPAHAGKKYNQEAFDRIEKFKNDLTAELGVRYNALFAVYPPGGFISWHNNQNAPGYNVLLTWSETGDGYWEHLDPVTKEIIRIDDIPGWQCKYGYYGSYGEGMEHVLYHAAATHCWRMTIAFVFNSDETGRMMSEMLIDEIQSEN